LDIEPDLPASRIAWTEQDRLAALLDTGLLDTSPEQAFDDIVLLAKTVCNTPVALVSLVDDDRQWFKARTGTDLTETPIDTSVCALAIQGDGLFQIEDLATDARTAGMSLVTCAPNIRFYAGIPLVTSRGYPLGSLCVIDGQPRPGGLHPAQIDALTALARQTMAQIEMAALFRHREDALAASHTVGTWDWDVQRNRVYADRRFCQIYGVDPAFAVGGAPIEHFFGNVHPDDLLRLQREIEAALSTRTPFVSEYRLIHDGGRVTWLAARGHPMFDPVTGEAIRFPGISYDISDQKGREGRAAALLRFSDRLRQCVEPADIVFAGCEALGEALDALRVGYGTIDVAEESVVITRDWHRPDASSLSGSKHYFRSYGSFIDALKRGETVVINDTSADPQTAPRVDKVRSIGVASLINLPLVEHGELVALLYVHDSRIRHWTEEEIGFIRDVAERVRSATERRRAEHALAELNASLEAQVETRTAELMELEEKLRQSQKMEAVGQLTGGLAHDFNNMLTGISGALEIMQVRLQQGRISDLERYATAARGAASRAAALTHRLLAFSRRQTLDPRPTDINRLVAGMEEIVRRTVGPSIAVEVVQAAGLWPSLVDQNQLENALLNLCINARDAMPNGGSIVIETANKWLDRRAAREQDLPEGQYVSLCVTDTGTGMTPEVKARAFDPFFTTKPMGEGTGLGLSMIYGFVRQSGGQVRIYTEAGEGTTMCLYLPRHYGEAQREDMPAGNAPFAQDGGGKTVLVVDDEPTIRMLVSEVIEEMGHAALEAHDGPNAVQLLQSNARIDLLITDVGLPGAMNGRQVADAARAVRPDLQVLFITGYAENAVLGNGPLESGMELVTKPFPMEVLASRVREMLDR
jgi:signal transduction histidine kinase/CheY-like chemotaxis protein/PAS domain-containing protein